MYEMNVLAALGSILWTLALSLLAIWVLTIIAYWRMFTKAGEKGWKAIIPVYSSYKMYTLIWRGSMFWLSLASSILASILVSLPTDSMGVLVVALILAIFSWVIGIMACFKMSRAYGHGVGYGFGLLFLNTIFILILGFGKSRYIGPQD